MRMTLIAFVLVLAAGAAPAEARPGDLDRSFSGDGQVRVAVGRYSEAYDVAVDRRGRVYAAGECCGYDDRGVIRLTRRGRLDRSFGRRGRARFYRSYRTVLELDHRDRALYIDLEERYANPPREPLVRVRRLTRGGRRDRTYGRRGAARFPAGDVIGAAPMPGGGIVVHAQSRSSLERPPWTVLARISAGGRVLWRTEVPELAAPSIAYPDQIAVTPSGVTVVAGWGADSQQVHVARVDATGKPLGTVRTPLSFEGDIDQVAMAAGRDDSVTIAAGDDRRILLTRITPEGDVDPALGIGGLAVARASRAPVPAGAELDRRGRLLIAGTDYSRGDARFGIARLTADGRFDAGFGSRGIRLLNAGRSVRSYATSLALGPRGGTVVVAGAASDEGGGIREDYGTRRFAFARFTLR